jgi:hypothetical protein
MLRRRNLEPYRSGLLTAAFVAGGDCRESLDLEDASMVVNRRGARRLLSLTIGNDKEGSMSDKTRGRVSSLVVPSAASVEGEGLKRGRKKAHAGSDRKRGGTSEPT